MGSDRDDAARESARKLTHLQKKHQILDREVEALNSRTYLSADDEAERKRLKKLKLATKDEISRLSS